MLHQIGSGVLGPVFRTYDPQRERLVAVKAFRLDIVPEDVARLADALRRLAAIAPPHPVIVTPLEGGLEGATAFLAMEYVTAETLDVALRHLAPAPLATILPIVRPLAEAIDAAWALTPALAHGALHPRDIFLAPGTNDVRMTGWGISTALESIGLRAPVRRPYSAPERNAGDPWDVRADVFSLGAITHELLTGRRPGGPGEQDGALPTATPPAQRVQIRKVLSAALAERPSHRFESAAAFVDALAAVGRGESMTFDFGAIGSESQEPEVPDVPAPAALPDRASLIAGDAASIGEGAAAVARDEAPSMTEFATDRMESEGAPSADVVAVPVADRVSEAAIASTAHPKAPTTAQISVKPAPPPLPPAAPDKPIDVIIDRGVLPPIEPRAMPARILSRQGDDRGGAIAPTAPAPFPWLTMAAVFAAGLVVGGVIVHRMGAGQPAENPAPKLATASASVAAPPADTGVPASTTEVVVTPPVENATPPALSASSAAPSRSPAPPVASPGRLLIHTDPAGALVAVDGKAHGKATAAVRDLPLGAHTITVTLAGFDAETRHVTLTAAQPSRELTVSLRSTRSSSPGTPKAPPAAGRQAAPPAAASSSSQLKTGAIDIDSRPPGARVFVDGKAIGVTPLRVPEVAIGAHTVRIELTGYKTLTTTVQVTAGQPAKLNVSLEPAIVSITSEGMGKRGNGGMSPRREEMGK